MAGKLVHFEVPADDTSRALNFYNEMFGWSFQAIEARSSTTWRRSPRAWAVRFIAPTRAACGSQKFDSLPFDRSSAFERRLWANLGRAIESTSRAIAT